MAIWYAVLSLSVGGALAMSFPALAPVSGVVALVLLGVLTLAHDARVLREAREEDQAAKRGV